MKVEVDVTPFVCLDCGQLQLMSDIESLQTPGNCDNADCEGGSIVAPGEHQYILVEITEAAKNAFDRAEDSDSQPSPQNRAT